MSDLAGFGFGESLISIYESDFITLSRKTSCKQIFSTRLYKIDEVLFRRNL